MVSRLIDLEYASIMCREAFGIYRPSDVNRVNKYGGFDIEYERLAFIDGEVDPWRPATPHSELARPRKSTLEKPFILIEGAGHHCELWFPRPVSVLRFFRITADENCSMFVGDENGMLANESTPMLPPKAVADAQAQEVKFVKKWMKGEF